MFSLRADTKIDVAVDLLDMATGTVYFGLDSNELPPIEILVSSSSKSPSVPEMREIYKWRRNNRANLVVVAIESKGRVHLYGPSEDRQPISVESATAQRVLQSALEDSNSISARRNLVSFYDNFGSTEMSGIKNKGLFATHHLRDNLPHRKDWQDLQSQGELLAKKRHRELIQALGFSISNEERNTLILKAGPENQVIAVLLEDNESFDSPSGRFPSSPVAWGLSVAADHNVPWLIVLKKDQIRLHPGRDGVGVSQKGQAETFLELNLAQIDVERLALLPLIFSATALKKDGDVQKLLDESSKYAVVLGARLRERVYESVVPNISVAVAKTLQAQGLAMDSEGLQRAYSMTLKILFRLLFQAYAEDRGLLPAGRNEGYDANSLKTIAKRDMEAGPGDFGNVVNIWHDLVQVWDSIDEGNPRWQVPAYNGGLFGRDTDLHPEGALIKSLELTDKILGPALQALLIDMTEDGVRGPVDFRSLSVREFGTIYEGLLESSLSLAEVDLTVDSKDAWVPAKDGDTVMAKAGEPYFHSASGERKATGSYFTPKFVVDHLVERAIDPTIDKHLEKIAGYLKAGDQATASREFFDFRVADLAMGSAHFLVAAVDRIEAKMRAFLSNPENMVPGVIDEIQRLRKAATEALRGDEIAINEIEDPSLLRRQIARRCIYGIDINPMAVELARLAIWIHTFVPGLPMSTLNHNLICANALTGIGSVEEALDALIPSRNGQATFFDDAIYSGLEDSKTLLIEAANASEADKSEVIAAAKLATDARVAAQNSRLIFDAALAARVGILSSGSFFSAADIVKEASGSEVASLIETLNPAHMPYLFPEVFLRANSGFDVLVGNPPWEKLQVDASRWWNLRRPGIMGMSQNQRDATIAQLIEENPLLEEQFAAEVAEIATIRDAILKGPFEGLGNSNPDLYQAFVWRNWQLLNSDGRLGLVLPRGALRGSALQGWRLQVLESGGFDDVVVSINTGGWLFPSVHPQYGIVFVVASNDTTGCVNVRGPIRSLDEFLNNTKLTTLDSAEFVSWSSTYSFPSISSEKDLEVIRQINQSPRLDSEAENWKVRAVQGDMNATTDKNRFDVSFPVLDNSMDVLTGGSFNLWDPKYGGPFAVADRSAMLSYLMDKVDKGITHSRSPYYGYPKSQMGYPFESPRIAYRWITNQTNSRTCIASLLPPYSPVVNSAPVLIFHRGGPRMEAFALGVMSSIPYDWAIRRWVEMNFTFEVLYPSRIPYHRVDTPAGNRLIFLAGSLAAVDETYNEWASKIPLQPSDVNNPIDKENSIYEMDALVAILYGIDEAQLIHIFQTFHRGWEYKPRLNKVLEFYEEWKDE